MLCIRLSPKMLNKTKLLAEHINCYKKLDNITPHNFMRHRFTFYPLFHIKTFHIKTFLIKTFLDINKTFFLYQIFFFLKEICNRNTVLRTMWVIYYDNLIVLINVLFLV